jgi:alanyl aminopeptidase
MADHSKLFLAVWLAGCGASPSVPAPMPSAPALAPPLATPQAVDPAPPPREDGRLPPGVKPTRYALDLVIDPAKPSFSGRARIGVAIDRPTSAIVMHGRGLVVKSAEVASSQGTIDARATLRLAAGSRGTPEELVLALARPVAAGAAEIVIDYEAPFADGLRGLYRVDEAGASYAYTQFEPNDARRAFPCFDEPANKTPYEVAITVPKGFTAFANTGEARRRESARGDFVTFEFERSRPLPTYLVAFGAGPLEVLDGPKQPTSVRLVAARGRASLGKMSVEAAASHLDLLGRYFDRPYPYPKLDVVAVPNFGAGAMENPGFVTFREELLLLDPEHASTVARRAMAGTMAHELAHQWFGDLVTMQWWDDLWLNEAFASWMSDKIVDQWRPESHARVLALGNKSAVMEEDALATARKIRNPVRSTSEAEEAFDAITYSKGRAVLSMTEAWLGEDVFREGLRQYVKKHEWGNATASDLYAALSEASGGREVAKVMDSFTDQTGVPLVAASLTCPAGAGTPVVELRQREYRTLERKEASDKLWLIPICVDYDAGGKTEKQCTLLDTAEARMELGTKGRCPAFVYPNAGEVGYFRVALGRGDLTRLRGALGRLSEQERFGVVSNVWAGVLSGDLAPSDYLGLLRSFKGETSKLVWAQIVESLAVIDRSVVSDGARPAFAKLVRDLVGPTAHRLGWTSKRGESDEQKLLRESVLGALGTLGNDDWALREAKRVADEWLADPMKTEADLARIAVPLAAKRGDAALFERLVNALKNPKTPEMRLIALAGLTGFEDATLVARTLALTLDGTIKTQDFRYVFTPLGQRRPTRDITYAWVENHFDELTKAMPAFIRARLINVASAMCDKDRVHAVESFLRPRVEKLEGAEKNAKQAVEEGMRCAALAEKEGAATSSWLAKQ